MHFIKFIPTLYVMWCCWNGIWFCISLSSCLLLVCRNKRKEFQLYYTPVTDIICMSIMKEKKMFLLGPHLWLYGSSQALDRIRAAAAGLHHSRQHRIQAAHATYTAAHGNTGPLTHWARSGIEPESSWLPVEFLTHWATTGTP